MIENNKQILAKDVILRAKKPDGNYYVLACVSSLNLQINGGMMETTTIGSGHWKQFVYDKKLQWTADLNGVCLLTDLVSGAWTLNELSDIPVGFKVLDIEITISDANGAGTVWEGTALLPDFGVSAQVQDGGEPAMWSVKLQGTGALSKRTIFAVAPPVVTGDDSGNTLSASVSEGVLYVSENNGAWAVYSGAISVGDVNRATGYWRFKATYNGVDSAIVNSPAFYGTITPPVVTLTSDDAANTLSAGTSQGVLYVSENNGSWIAYNGTITVGDVNRAAGYWRFKATYNGVDSAIVNSPAFYASTGGSVAAPVVTSNDSANTLSASASQGVLYVSENNGSWVVYNGTISVGDVNRAAGYWRFKATYNGVDSAIVNSPAFYVSTGGSVAAPVVTGNDSANTLSASASQGVLYVSENNGAWAVYSGTISVGDVNRAAGYWRFKAVDGSNESSIVNSPAFNSSIVVPVPTLTANDTNDTLSASASQGMLYVSVNNGAWTVYSGTINVGDNPYAAGYWRFKATYNGVDSAIVYSPAFTYAGSGGGGVAAPVVTGNDSTNMLSATASAGSIYYSTTGGGVWSLYTGPIYVGSGEVIPGAYIFRVSSGGAYSSIVNSPAFTADGGTPSTIAAPVLSGDDYMNTLDASASEGVVYVKSGVDGYTQYAGTINVGNSFLQAGYYKFVSVVNGRESAVVNSPEFTANTLPEPPVVVGNDTANTLTVTKPRSYGTLMMKVYTGAWQAYSEITGIGNVTYPAGYWKFKITHNGVDSAVVDSPAFNAYVAPPTVTGDDVTNTITVSTSEDSIMYSTSEGAAWTLYTEPIVVGDVDLPAGHYWFVANKNGIGWSAVVYSPAFTKS